MPQQTKQPFVTGSAFKLNNNAAYLPWREERMGADKPVLSDLLVQINNPYQLSDDEKLAIIERCKNFNMAVYQLHDPDIKDKSLVHALGKQLAMKNLDANIRADEDSVSSLEVRLMRMLHPGTDFRKQLQAIVNSQSVLIAVSR